MKLDQQAEITRRLRCCAAGHLNAVIEITEAGQPCEQVLHQLNAVQAALRAVGTKVIRCQARSSQAVILLLLKGFKPSIGREHKRRPGSTHLRSAPVSTGDD